MPTSSSTQEVRPAATYALSKINAILTDAFSQDPAARWLFPDEHIYTSVFPTFSQAFGGGDINPDVTDVIGDRAAARWLAPGMQINEDDIQSIISKYVPADRLSDVGTLFDALDKHHPQQTHWYLPLIGVRCSDQGSGLGALLMQAGLKRCDNHGLPAYLEASNIRSVPFYQRFGFEARGVIRVADCPPIYPMWRNAVD